MISIALMHENIQEPHQILTNLTEIRIRMKL